MVTITNCIYLPERAEFIIGFIQDVLVFDHRISFGVTIGEDGINELGDLGHFIQIYEYFYEVLDLDLARRLDEK